MTLKIEIELADSGSARPFGIESTRVVPPGVPGQPIR
jgi:hypothetical protein